MSIDPLEALKQAEKDGEELTDEGRLTLIGLQEVELYESDLSDYYLMAVVGMIALIGWRCGWF